MVAIATRQELANLLQMPVPDATADLALALAQGLITEILGDLSSWPAVAKSTCLASAGRPLRNPEGLKRMQVNTKTNEYNAEELGVYLTPTEEARLRKWAADHDADATTSASGPVGGFPCPETYPDPALPYATNPYSNWTIND